MDVQLLDLVVFQSLLLCDLLALLQLLELCDRVFLLIIVQAYMLNGHLERISFLHDVQ